MDLSRRDALAALAAVGVGGAALYVLEEEGDGGAPGGGGAPGDGATPGGGSVEDLLETAVALSAVVYPSSVTGREEFVRTYVSGRVEDDEAYGAEMAEAAAALDAHAEDQYGAPFRELSAAEGDELLHELQMERIGPDPDASGRPHLRYYLINELLYALMASPKGGELAGIANPPGHPGGLEAYQQGPQG